MDNIDDGLIHLTDNNTINSKETRIQMIRKLMEQVLEDDNDDTFKESFSLVTDTIDNYESIDREMVTRLNSIFSNDLLKRENFDDIIKAISSGSTVVYFKSAQLFKVYKPLDVEQLLGGQLRTIYKQLNESFEVVPNDSKQKIVMLCDSSLENKIERIKKYIVNFMVKEGIIQFTDKDIVCYKGKEALEIIINDYYVDNQDEHDKVVQKLLKYITKEEKSSNIERYMGTAATYSEFDGIKMIQMPSGKELFATTYIEPLLTMVSNVNKCSGFKNQMNLNVTINNDNSVNSVNSVDNSINTTNITQNEDNIDISQFIEYILEETPTWYTPDKWILISTLYDKFVEITNSMLTRQKFSMYINTKLFIRKAQKVINNKKGRAVLLVKYDNIIT